MRRSLRAGVGAGTLLAALGGLVWATGLPALFPSLGPTAFVLVTEPEAPDSRWHRVVGGHAIGVLAGLVSYRAFADGTVMTTVPPAFSTAALGLALGGVVAVALTSAAMLATDLRHSPACATTLIVALGLLSTPVEGALVLAAVVLLVALHRAVISVWTAVVAPRIASVPGGP